MAAFQFPNPAEQQTVVNPITGSTYQWKEDPGKWVVAIKIREVGDIIWEGDNPPNPIGDYKLWYSTDTLELYFHYTDANGVSAWVPTSAPITMLEDLDTGLSEVKLELVAANVAINENTNRIESFIYFGEEPPVIYPDVDTGSTTPDGTDEGAPIFEQDERNYKLWLNTTTDKLSVLRIDEAADVGYSYQEIDTDNNVTLQEVTENGNSTNQGIEIKNSRLKTYGEVYFQSNGDTPVTLDSGSSYKPMLHLKSYSNTATTEEGEPDTFARKDVLKISARGEAELFGHLKAEPGENSNQVIVYDQYKELQDSIVSLQQEIEKLSLVLDEGGDYRLLSTPENPADFVRDGIVYFGNTAGNPITNPSSWDEVGSIFIDEKDRNGDTHDFGPDIVRPGDLIELIGDNSFALFEVKGTGQYEEGLNKRFAVWATTTVKSTGVPGPQDTEYKIKSFRLGSLDVAETDARYVNLTGDEMTGPLQIKPDTAAVALDLHPGPNQSSGTSILRVYGDGGKTNLYISGSGSLGARQGWSPSLSNHLTTKDYVDLLDAQTRDYVDNKFNEQMPVGSIVFWGGTRAKIPSGWQECDGSAVSAATKAFTGMSNTPNLQDYFPAGVGGRFASTIGNQYGSRLKKHTHEVLVKEPKDTTGNPDDSQASSTSRYRYWRGNADSDGTSGKTVSKTTKDGGDSSFNAPPVVGGIYIMKVA